MRYPDTPRPSSPYPFRDIRPSIAGGPYWAPQVRALTAFGLLEVDLQYAAKSAADMMTLFQFYEDVRGPVGRFTFVDFNGCGYPGSGTDPGIAWTGLFVAQGDGVTASWDLPCYHIKSSPMPKVYEDGVEKTVEFYTDAPNPAINYHIHQGGGTDDLDTMFATTAPLDGVIVTIDATCRRALRLARFTADRNPFQLQVVAHYSQPTVTIAEARK